MNQDQAFQQTSAPVQKAPDIRPGFDPATPYKIYTNDEWDVKEKWYSDRIIRLQMPSVPNSADIRNYSVEIEKILTAARIDYAYIKQNYEEYDTILNNKEKVLFLELKMNPPGDLTGLKLTVDEIKGAVVRYLETTEFKPGLNLSLYDIVKTTRRRYTFIDNMVRALAEKRENIVTHITLNKQDSMGGGPMGQA